VWREWPWWEYAFFSDGSSLAWLSSALLLANAAVALTITLTGKLPSAVGGGLSAALVYLSLDEQFQLHEQFKAGVGAGRLGDLPTVLIGVGGAAALAFYWRKLPTETARRLFGLAIMVGVFALWVDLGSPPLVVGQLEEGFEVIAESLFLSGLLELARSQVQSGSER
jgi:hypothetical protein